MSENIKFSVVTVCYNAESTIEKTILSVCSQSYNNFEYIIVDGKSNDETVALVEKYVKQYKEKIVFISEKDAGIYDAMNKAVKLSKGEYLVFMNSDDLMCENTLEKIALEIEKNQYPDIMYGDSVVTYSDGEKQIEKIRKAYPVITLKTLIKGMGVTHQSMFTKKTVFEKVGLFSLEYSIGADWDFLIRCVQSKVSLVYVGFPVSIFSTEGVSSKVHNMQRHKIRKANKLYKVVDIGLIQDIFNVGTMIQLFIGENLYKKLRFSVNKAKSRRVR